MSQINIEIPRAMNWGSCVEFSQKLKNYSLDSVYVFDFSNSNGFHEPFGILYIMMQIRKFIREKPKSSFKMSNFRDLTYPAHVGFFQGCGLDFGKMPGEAKGGANYHPIEEIDIAEVWSLSEKYNEHVAETVNGKCRHLAEVVCQASTGNFFELMHYIIREMVRNSIEHSKGKKVYFFGQHWSNGYVEIGIADEGIGLSDSLSGNKLIDVSDDVSAIDFALMPGISGVHGARRNIGKKSVWDNSGFGLYMVSSIAKNFNGSFCLLSGSAGREVTPYENKNIVNVWTKGVAIRFRIKTENIPRVNPLLERISKDGEEIAKKLGEAAIKSASSASKRSEV